MLPTPITSWDARPDLDAVVGRVRDGARAWARLPIRDRIETARRMHAGIAAVADRSVAAACAAKGIPRGAAAESEEWLTGPYVGLRILRQVIESLEAVARGGTTPIGPLGRTHDGRLTVRVFPSGLADRVVFPGMLGEVHLVAGVDEETLHATRARFYRSPDHDGRVCVVLGAGNINSIPVADVATKLFNEGTVCVLKTHPVNAYLAPLLREAFADAIARGFVGVVQGGAEEGAYLVEHPAVDEIHMTGSDATHDLLVWGPPGPERDRRRAERRPRLVKRITSELGNTGPMLVVPGPYDAADLRAQAMAIAAGFAVNAAFACATTRVVITARDWSGRGPLLRAVTEALAQVPPRVPFYPGAEDRRRALLAGRAGCYESPPGAPGTMPWAFLAGLSDPGERAFSREHFCPVLCEACIAAADPVRFLEGAVRFANERLWGTLHAMIVVHPRSMRDPAIAEAVDRAVEALRYGSVCVNTWTGFAFAMGVMPWGGHPGSTAEDIQSGAGFVHNTRMIENIEKGVMRSPFRPLVKPPWYPDHRSAVPLARRLTALERTGSLAFVPSVMAAAVRG